MAWLHRSLILVVLIGALTAFYKTAEAPTPTASFGGVSLRIEYALTPAERERGLSNRAMVSDDYGMLFVFPAEGRYGFWMKDTLVPLDIFWLDSKGQVVSIAPHALPDSYPHVFYPLAPARYVLETRAGFAAAHRIATGTPLLLPTWPHVSK